MLGEIALVVLTVVAGPARQPCQGNPNLMGGCVFVHGRLRAYNGNPTFRIWPVGTKRLLGATGAHPGEEPIMPGDLGAPGHEMTGALLVAPQVAEDKS